MSFSVGTFSALSLGGTRIHFKKIDPTDSAHHLVDAAQGRITGSRFPRSEYVVPGQEVHRHHILLEPTAEEFAVLLPLMGIPVTSGTTYTISETLSSFSMIIDRVAKVHTYGTSYVDKWILRGQKGLKPWALELQIVSLGDTEGAAGSFTPTPPATATGPYPFSKGTMTLGGTGYAFDQFVLACDNRVLLRYNNAETADDAMATGCELILATSLPYTATEAGLFTTGSGSNRADGVVATLAFSLAGVSTSFAIANVKTPNQPPKIESKFAEVRLPRYFTGYATSGTALLVVTHDSTP